MSVADHGEGGGYADLIAVEARDRASRGRRGDTDLVLDAAPADLIELTVHLQAVTNDRLDIDVVTVAEADVTDAYAEARKP